MSKIPYTVNVEEYVCTELERIRKMNESRDYSSLLACIERIQFHVSQMEYALHSYELFKTVFKGKDWRGEMTDKELLKELKTLIKEVQDGGND